MVGLTVETVDALDYAPADIPSFLGVEGGGGRKAVEAPCHTISHTIPRTINWTVG